MAKKNNTAKYMVYFMAFIMISSVFAVMFYGFANQEGTAKYGKIKFTQTDNGWTLNTKTQQYNFDYLPQEVDFMNLSSEMTGLLSNTLEIDVTSEVNNSDAETIAFVQFAMDRNLPQKYIRVGFSTNSSFNTPIFDCSDATQLVPVVYFKSGNETKFIEEGNCLIAQSRDNFGFIRIKDRLLYAILGII